MILKENLIRLIISSHSLFFECLEPSLIYKEKLFCRPALIEPYKLVELCESIHFKTYSILINLASLSCQVHARWLTLIMFVCEITFCLLHQQSGSVFSERPVGRPEARAFPVSLC